MTPDVPPMRFFIDQCVPDSVGRALREAGYEIILLREKIATNSPDTLVAAVAEANSAILVTMDADFKKIAGQYGIGQNRFKKLSLVRFNRCRESQAAQRIASALSLLEHEWTMAKSKQNGRLFVVISTSTITTNR